MFGGIKLKMTDLKQEFEAAGLTDVATVLATGNVIFSSKEAPDLSFLPVQAFVKTEQQVKKMLENNPLAIQEDYHIYIFVAEEAFAQIALSEFESLKTAQEAAAVKENIFYWKVPKGSTLGTPFGKILGKKAYKELFTSRNINTMEKIINKI